MPRRLRLQPSKAQEVTSDGFAVLTEGAQYRAPADPPPTPLLYAHQNPAAILTEKRVAWAKKKIKKIKTHQNLCETGENLQKVLRSQPWWRGGDTRGWGELTRCCGLRRSQWISHSKQFSQAASIFKAQTAITALFQQQKWTGESADGQRASLLQSPRVCSWHLRWVITEDSGASSDTVVPSSPVLYNPSQKESLQPDKWQGAAGTKMHLAQNHRGHRWLLRAPRHTVLPCTELGTGGCDGAQAPPINPP